MVLASSEVEISEAVRCRAGVGDRGRGEDRMMSIINHEHGEWLGDDHIRRSTDSPGDEWAWVAHDVWITLASLDYFRCINATALYGVKIEQIYRRYQLQHQIPEVGQWLE